MIPVRLVFQDLTSADVEMPFRPLKDEFIYIGRERFKVLNIEHHLEEGSSRAVSIVKLDTGSAGSHSKEMPRINISFSPT